MSSQKIYLSLHKDSTPDYPKQFIDVMGVGKSLIQLAVERFSSLCPLTNVIAKDLPIFT